MPFSIIIPSKTASNLVPCIRAIREAGETARIIVVWDAPKTGDPSVRDLWEVQNAIGGTDSGCVVIRGVTPFVFARNCNLGIEEACDDDVIILNDDALLKTPRGLSFMAEKVREGTLGHGLVAATCNNVGNVNQHPHPYKAGDFYFRDEPRMVCFVAVYIPRSTIDTVGLLDERFVGGGFEDDDYCLRVRRAGLKIGIFDGCFVDHSSLTSTFRGSGGPGYDPRGAEIFREKWGAGNHDL